MQVILYSTTTCPYCQMLKDYLQAKGVLFTEKLVDQDEGSKNEMMAKSGGYLGVPFTVITKDNGDMVTIIGFDKKRMDEILGLH